MGDNTTPSTPVTTPYRKSVFDVETGRVLESYIVLPRNDPSLAEQERLVSEVVDVSAGDVVVYSGEIKTKYHSSGSSNLYFLKIVLRAYDGTIHTLDGGVGVATGDTAEFTWVGNIGAYIRFYPGEYLDKGLISEVNRAAFATGTGLLLHGLFSDSIESSAQKGTTAMATIPLPKDYLVMYKKWIKKN